MPIGEGCLNGGVASHRMGVVMAQKGGVVIQINVRGGRGCERSGRGYSAGGVVKGMRVCKLRAFGCVGVATKRAWRFK